MHNRVQKSQPRVAAVSLGCVKNRIDTEEILGLLGSSGFLITESLDDAGIVLVNTCAFIDDAQQESIETILGLARRRRGRRPLIIAAGCLAEKYGGKLLESIPELDGVIGVHGYQSLPEFLRSCSNGRREALVAPPAALYRSIGPRLLTTAPHSVFVKIAEGCGNRCRYCLIPSLRGGYRSRPVSEILDEVRVLAARGAREVNLIAQDTTAYGTDLEGAPDLAGLVREILDLPGAFWIRLLYAYPSRLTEELIDLISGEPRICSYLDLPLQHVDSGVLRRMGRFYSGEEIVSLVEKLRRRIPGLALRTTYLVGFPGESRRQFRRLFSFIFDHPFERVGVFAYSRQQGTAAAVLPGQVPRRVAEKRRRALLAAQQGISLSLNRKLTGSRAVVLVERRCSRAQNVYFGRTQYQAPAVDGGVFFRFSRDVEPGNWVSVRLAAVSPYHLLGTAPILLHEPTI